MDDPEPGRSLMRDVVLFRNIICIGRAPAGAALAANVGFLSHNICIGEMPQRVLGISAQSMSAELIRHCSSP
jgi:hypothetical protein